MATKRSVRWGLGVRAVGVGAALCCVATGAGTLASGCFSSNNASPGPADDAATDLDATTPGLDAPVSTPDADSASPNETGPGPSDSGDAGAALDGSDGAAVLTIPMPGGAQPVSLAFNATNSKLYVGLANPLSGANGGIAVVDTTTNTVTASIPAVVADSGMAQPYYYSKNLALDTTANLIFGARLFSTVIDVFDGATNTLKATFDEKTLDANCDTVSSIAVAPAMSRLYVSCAGASPTQMFVDVVNSTTDAFVTSVPIADLQASNGALALDTTNQLLFVSNGGGAARPVLVDVINTATTTLGDAGSQQNLGPGYALDPKGGQGYASLVTRTVPDGGPDAGPDISSFCSLEPSSAPVTGGFNPQGSTDLPGTPFAVAVLGQTFAGPQNGLDGIKAQIPATESATPATLTPLPFVTLAAAGTSVQLGELAANQAYLYMTLYLYLGTGSTPPSGVVCAPRSLYGL